MKCPTCSAEMADRSRWTHWCGVCGTFVDEDAMSGAQVRVPAQAKTHAAALAFKVWVHQYLDSHGVPRHPPGPHGAEGCRIGDRMDWLVAERDRLRAAADDSRAFVRHALEFFGWAAFPHLRESVEQLRDKLDAALGVQP